MVNIEEEREGNWAIVTFFTEYGWPIKDNEATARLFFRVAGWLKSQSDCSVSAISLQEEERGQIIRLVVVHHPAPDMYVTAEGS